MDLETLAFNRDPASIRTLASSSLCLLMSFFPMFLGFVNFTLYVNFLHLYTYIHIYINEFITRNTVKQSSNQRRGKLESEELSVYALSLGRSYDVTSVWMVL